MLKELGEYTELYARWQTRQGERHLAGGVFLHEEDGVPMISLFFQNERVVTGRLDEEGRDSVKQMATVPRGAWARIFDFLTITAISSARVAAFAVANGDAEALDGVTGGTIQLVNDNELSSQQTH